MKADDWQAIVKIFEAALEKSETDRGVYIREACAGDAQLEFEVTKLLMGDAAAGDFLDLPALGMLSGNVDLNPERCTFSTGSILSNRFEIKRFVGQGGMGLVYEAFDLELKTKIALKVIRQELSSNPKALSRFRQEVLLTRRVTHPNICRTFDIDRHPSTDGIGGDVTFLTMELLDGETLADLLRRRGRLPTSEALPLVTQMTEALSAAHMAGIVHRDLKPSNVILVQSGKSYRAVVTDFGVARLIRAHSELAPGETGSILSSVEELVGTLAYMAPEQLERGEVSIASDIYSLGLVMYEMVTGSRPFADERPFAEALNRIKRQAPSATLCLPGLDAAWDSTICKCLESQPAHRFQAAKDVSLALRSSVSIERAPAPDVQSGRPLPSWKNNRTGSWRGWFGVLCLFILLASVFLATFRLSNRKHTPIAFAERDQLLVTDFDNQTGEVTFDRIVRDLTVQSLGQSTFVNVVPRSTALEAAKRVGLAQGHVIDQKFGRELCNQEHYAAMLTGRIAKAGGRYVITAIVEGRGPHPSVFSDTESIDSTDRLYSGIDQLTARIRQHLGEPLSKIESAAKPLAQVTTSSLTALQRYSVAVDLYDAREYSRAIALAQDAVDRDEHFGMAHLLLARAYEQLGSDSQSAAEFSKAWENADRASEREKHLIRASALASQQQNFRAAQEYQHLLDIYPDDLDSLRGFAIASYYAGYPERGIAAQRRLLALSPNDPSSYDYLLELLVRTNQFSDALTVYEQARLRNVDTTSFRFLAAIAAWGNGNLHQAQLFLSVPPNKDSDYIDVVSRLYKGKLLTYQGRASEAMDVFRAGLAFSNRPGLEDWARVFQYQIANVALLQKHASVAHLESRRYEALVRGSSNAGNLERAGVLSEVDGDTRSANQFQKQLALRAHVHSDPFTLMELSALKGRIEFAQGKDSQAVDSERLALNIQPGYESLLLLAQACEKVHNWNCAKTAYSQYLDMKGAIFRYDVASDWVTAHYFLARVYVSLGDRELGIEYCQTFLEMFASADVDLPVVRKAARDLATWKKELSELKN